MFHDENANKKLLLMTFMRRGKSSM